MKLTPQQWQRFNEGEAVQLEGGFIIRKPLHSSYYYLYDAIGNPVSQNTTLKALEKSYENENNKLTK